MRRRPPPLAQFSSLNATKTGFTKRDSVFRLQSRLDMDFVGAPWKMVDPFLERVIMPPRNGGPTAGDIEVQIFQFHRNQGNHYFYTHRNSSERTKMSSVWIQNLDFCRMTLAEITLRIMWQLTIEKKMMFTLDAALPIYLDVREFEDSDCVHGCIREFLWAIWYR